MDANIQWWNSADGWFRCQVYDKNHIEFLDKRPSSFYDRFSWVLVNREMKLNESHTHKFTKVKWGISE